jgi:hypothetical protein
MEPLTPSSTERTLSPVHGPTAIELEAQKTRHFINECKIPLDGLTVSACRLGIRSEAKQKLWLGHLFRFARADDAGCYLGGRWYREAEALRVSRSVFMIYLEQIGNNTAVSSNKWMPRIANISLV